jgi:transitional endoplasmic reticulum ATPase
MIGEKSIRLKVVEANSLDPFKSRVRLDKDVMEQLNLKLNDYVAIKGNNLAIGRVYEMREDDSGRGEIRLDSITRENCGSKVNDSVEVYKIDPVPAKSVKLTPAGRNYPSLNNELLDFFRRLLYQTALFNGNVIAVNLPGDFKIGGTSTPLYRSVETEPVSVAVYISNETELTVV